MNQISLHFTQLLVPWQIYAFADTGKCCPPDVHKQIVSTADVLQDAHGTVCIEFRQNVAQKIEVSIQSGIKHQVVKYSGIPPCKYLILNTIT